MRVDRDDTVKSCPFVREIDDLKNIINERDAERHRRHEEEQRLGPNRIGTC